MNSIKLGVQDQLGSNLGEGICVVEENSVCSRRKSLKAFILKYLIYSLILFFQLPLITLQAYKTPLIFEFDEITCG